MKRFSAVTALVAAFLFGGFHWALAAKPQLATLSGSPAAYTVVFDGKKGDNQFDLWVASICTDAGDVTVTAEYQPVVWVGDMGATAPFSAVIGSAPNPFAGPIDSCHAYVWEFPDAWAPVSNTVQFP